MNFAEQNILITGASRGIGLAFASAMAKEKSHLHLMVRKKNELLEQELLSQGAASVTWWEIDLSQAQSLENFLKLNMKDLKVNVLFNNAGVLTGGLFENQTDQEIADVVQVNIHAVMQLSRFFLPSMIEQKNGFIINNSSVSAIMHFPCASTYAASKAAVWAFTECLQTELQATGVTAMCLITPGIKTRMFDEIADKYGQHIKVPQDSITPEEYANRILKAMRRKQNFLYPQGLTLIGLSIARHLPQVFQKVVGTQFSRKGIK